LKNTRDADQDRNEAVVAVAMIEPVAG